MRMKAQRAAPIALVTAIAVATAIYGMPMDQAVLSAAEGATFGLFPIMWIVVAAIWVYNMTVESGHFAILGRSIASVSQDHRIQAVLIAFCFGTLMEAMAGFGAPAAITAVMMVALGFKPMTAAALALLGNTAAVPFGALGIPITTLSEVTGLDKGELGAMVGRQTPLLGLIVPFILVGMVDGRRGIRQAWPVAAVGGLAFALAQFTCSNHISVELTDIVASISSIAAIVALLRVWAPPEPLVAESARRDDAVRTHPSTSCARTPHTSSSSRCSRSRSCRRSSANSPGHRGPPASGGRASTYAIPTAALCPASGSASTGCRPPGRSC